MAYCINEDKVAEELRISYRPRTFALSAPWRCPLLAQRQPSKPAVCDPAVTVTPSGSDHSRCFCAWTCSSILLSWVNWVQVLAVAIRPHISENSFSCTFPPLPLPWPARGAGFASFILNFTHSVSRLTNSKPRVKLPHGDCWMLSHILNHKLAAEN